MNIKVVPGWRDLISVETCPSSVRVHEWVYICLQITCINDTRVGVKPGRQNKAAESREAEDEEVTGRVEVHILEREKEREREGPLPKLAYFLNSL